MANEFAALKPVQSSMFSRAGYDEANWNLLFEFKSTGEIRCYKNVSPEVADECLAAKSIGSWWNQNVKGNAGWEFEVLGADPAVQAQEPKKPEVQGGITDDDIRAVESGWNGMTVEAPPRLEDSDWPKGEKEYVENELARLALPQSDAGDITLEKVQDALEVAGIPADSPVPPHVWPTYGGIQRGEGPMDAAMTAQPQPEVLAAWEPPKNPVEAIIMLQSRESEIQAIVQQNGQQARGALELRVTDVFTHAGAGQELTNLVNSKDRTVKLLDPIRAILYESYKMAGERCKAATEPLDQAITHVKRMMGAWEMEEERKRQAKIREEREKAEAAARELQKQQSQQMTLAEVQEAVDAGDTERAEQLMATPIEVPRPYVAPAPVQPTYLPPAGQSTRTNWKVDEESADLVKFLMAVKEGKFPIDKAARLIKPDVPALNKMAKALESAFDVPGFTAIMDTVRVVRRGK